MQPVTPDAAPTPPRERVASLDTVRGAAILGILLLNVRAFAMPGDGYVYPLADDALDVAAYAVVTAVGQGKFLAIFAALYGAGLGFLAEKGDALFLRRTGVLAAIGLAHMTLVWHGDVLLLYAVCGLAVYAMRNVATWVLWLAALAGHLTTGALFALLWAAVSFSGEEVALLNGTEAETAAFLGGYGDQFAMRLTIAARDQVPIFLAFSPATLALMLAGMALMRSGFFAGAWTGRGYAIAATLGISLGIGGSGAIVAWGWQSGWPVEAWVAWGQIGLEALAPLGAFGLAAVVVVAAKRLAWLAPVGRMALTNYLAQSVVGTFAFYGGWGLGWFGRVGYAGQLAFVAGVWAVQIAWSHAWLRRFRFGPAELLWRWATYGRRPALRWAS